MWFSRHPLRPAPLLSSLSSEDPAGPSKPAAQAGPASHNTNENTCQTIEQDIDRAVDDLAVQNTQTVEYCRSMTDDARGIATEAHSLASSASELNRSVTSIAGATEELSAAGREIATQAARSSHTVRNTMTEMDAAGQTVQALNQAAQGIGDVVRAISEIANRTNLLALNATIEAARAGEAGRGFAIVAAEVKSLARQTKALTEDVARRVTDIRSTVASTGQVIETIGTSVRLVDEANASVAASVQEQDATIAEISRCLQEAARDTAELAGSVETVSRRALAVQGLSERTGQACQQTSAVIEDLSGRLILSLRNSALGDRRAAPRVPVEMRATVHADGRDCAGTILDLSEGGALFRAATQQSLPKGRGRSVLSLAGIGDIDVERVGGSQSNLHLMFKQYDTATAGKIEAVLSACAADDKRFIAAAIHGARATGDALTRSLAQGLVTEKDLFEPVYEPVPSSNPQQVLTRFTALTDELFPPIQEEALRLDKRIVFAAAVDRNAYLPTHNAIYNNAQRPDDLVWNAANCRNRRIFNDRAGLAAARCHGEHQLQTYERDMGGDRRVLLKEADAPIVVNGKPWGGFRLCYRVA